MKFENDYIMRIVHDMVQMLMKLIFDLDEDPVVDYMQQTEETEDRYQRLLNLANAGKINDAENMLYDMIDETDKADLFLGLQFYDYLNHFNSDFLSDADYSREEVREGMETLLNMYGYQGMGALL